MSFKVFGDRVVVAKMGQRTETVRSMYGPAAVVAVGPAHIVLHGDRWSYSFVPLGWMRDLGEDRRNDVATRQSAVLGDLPPVTAAERAALEAEEEERARQDAMSWDY